MISEAPSQPQKICERLTGHHILVTGSTGFLAKAFVEKLLRSVDTLGGIHLLVRPRSDGTSADQRVRREVLSSRAFDRLRASLGEGFARLCEQKIHVVPGDLTKDRFGLSVDEYEKLTQRITLVVNSAATVTFDECIDLAVDLNTLGPSRLLRFASDCGNAPFLHVSTSYVCGRRDGTVGEDFSAPTDSPEPLPRLEPDGAPDLDALIESMRGEATELRHRFGADSDMCRRELIEAGMRRARSHGWNDTYTFTKWLGEQLLVRDRGEVPLVVFRPAIIESSFEEPMPGWIDGLRMADPVIVAYGKGRLNEFPGLPDIAIDLIPVDFVANAMIATLPVGEGWDDDVRVYHCASSKRNPFLIREMRIALMKAYRIRPMHDDAGRKISAGNMRLVERGAFIRSWNRRKRVLGWIQAIAKALQFKGRRLRRLAAAARQIDQVLYFAKIYAPYTHLHCRFADDAMQAVGAKLHPEDRDAFSFDAGRIDWDDYFVNRHVPGLRSYVSGAGGEPSPRILAAAEWDAGGISAAAEALRGGGLFDCFRRAAERFGEKPALQVRRHGRWYRYTYEDALRATGAIMQRFLDRGLVPGDRVAICGESAPEWGLTYLACMRAGLTAVPLDPQLPPDDAWSAARFAGAKLMCATPTTEEGLTAKRGDADAELIVMREPFIPRPGASRDIGPDAVSVEMSDVASILFTSGTTVSPKAVQLTHGNLMANARSLVKVQSVGASDELLSVLPMYHAFEFTGGFIVPLMCGATITYVDQLKAPEITAAMQETGTTVMLVVPRLLRMFSGSIDTAIASSGIGKRLLFRLLWAVSQMTRHQFARQLFRPVHTRFGGRLRMFICGGSRLDPESFDTFRAYGFEVYEGYGLTETSPVLSVNPRGHAKRGSVGKPVPGVEIEIRNQNLEGIGEIWAKGASVMAGYLNNPEATREILVDGWIRTGDLGRWDDDDYLHLTGRTKDLIITSAGKNVYPDEVEARYRELPHVSELCVFGMPSGDGLGDTVQAVVVLDPNAATDVDRSSIERQIRAAAESIGEVIPTHQQITTLHFWNRDLPKTSTLKAKRSLIRDMVRAERSGVAPGAPSSSGAPPQYDDEDVSETESTKLEAVRSILARQTQQPVQTIRPSSHLHLDLGVDSIGKIDVIGSIEIMFGMQIDGEIAAKIARVSDLLKVIGDRTPKTEIVAVAKVQPRRVTATPVVVPTNGALPAPLVPMRWLVRGGITAMMNTYVRVQVRGREHIPATGPFVLAPNHASHLDTPSVISAVGSRRRVWVAGAEDYFFSTPLKRLVFGKLLDTIPFDRQSDGLIGLRRCSETLRGGDGLLIFPEGTRSINGQMQHFKIGIAVLSIERSAPIIPVYIDRAFDLMPKGQRMARPGVLTVTFGEPIVPPDLADVENASVAYRELTQRVEDAVVALAGGAHA